MLFSISIFLNRFDPRNAFGSMLVNPISRIDIQEALLNLAKESVRRALSQTQTTWHIPHAGTKILDSYTGSVCRYTDSELPDVSVSNSNSIMTT